VHPLPRRPSFHTNNEVEADLAGSGELKAVVTFPFFPHRQQGGGSGSSRVALHLQQQAAVGDLSLTRSFSTTTPDWIRWRAAESMVGPPFGGRSRADEARSGGREAGSGGKDADLEGMEEDPAGGRCLTSGEQRRWRSVDGLDKPVHGFSLFYFINRGGHQTASENSLFTMTLGSRRFGCLP
jgi:hypothetical protein